jgi:DNA-binding NtrC family response regulator
VRQLYNVLERAVLLADGPVLLPAHLPAEVRAPAHGFVGTPGALGTIGAFGALPTPSHGMPSYAVAGYAASSYAVPSHGLPSQSPAVSERLLPLGELERRHIAHALALTGGHLARAAELLGIHRNTLRRKLQEYEEVASAPAVPAAPDALTARESPPGIAFFEPPVSDHIS